MMIVIIVSRLSFSLCKVSIFSVRAQIFRCENAHLCIKKRKNDTKMVSFFLFLCFICGKFSLFGNLTYSVICFVAFLDYEAVTVNYLFNVKVGGSGCVNAIYASDYGEFLAH